MTALIIIYIVGCIASVYLHLCFINSWRNYWFEKHNSDFYDDYPHYKFELRSVVLCTCSWLYFLWLAFNISIDKYLSFKQPFYKYGKK